MYRKLSSGFKDGDQHRRELGHEASDNELIGDPATFQHSQCPLDITKGISNMHENKDRHHRKILQLECTPRVVDSEANISSARTPREDIPVDGHGVESSSDPEPQEHNLV